MNKALTEILKESAIHDMDPTHKCHICGTADCYEIIYSKERGYCWLQYVSGNKHLCARCHRIMRSFVRFYENIVGRMVESILRTYFKIKKTKGDSHDRRKSRDQRC